MLNAVDDHQQSLGLRVVRECDVKVSMDVINKRKDLHEALLLAVEVANIDDKVICLELGIDNGQWSRIKSGSAHFPDAKYNQLLDILGNELPLQWWANSRGYKLVKIRSRLEDELEAERQKSAELEMKVNMLMDIATAKK